MDATLKDAKKIELSAELRKARGWILAVGLIMFAVDMIMIYAVYGDRLPAAWKNKLTMYDSIILAYFVGLWWFAQKKPKLCCILALVGFWGLHLYIATLNPESLAQGLVLKIFFTIALVNGLRSASRAESLQKELAEVFG